MRRHLSHLQSSSVGWDLATDEERRDVAIEVRHLRHFVALAEELNFTRAARRLGIAQQSLSHSISRFEAELGVRLVDRDSRSTRLTPVGAAVLRDARQVLDDLDALLRRAHGRADHLGGTLRLGCSYDLQPLLTPLLTSLRGREPDLTARVTVGAQRGLLDDMRAHRLDAVVTWRRPAEDADLRVHQLLSARLLPVVRDTDPLALAGRPVRRHQLHGTVALDLEPPMTIDVHLLRMPNAPDGTRRALSYLADLAATAREPASRPASRSVPPTEDRTATRSQAQTLNRNSTTSPSAIT